jgi:protocadherin-16/23
VVTDVNDNAPEIVDPQEDVVSVREEQPAGTEVVRIRAIDRDNGHNATITYSILKGRDSDGYGYGMFSIDPVTGLIRTRVSLDHEEHTIYRLAVAASKLLAFFLCLSSPDAELTNPFPTSFSSLAQLADGGKPPKQTTRLLRIEVLDLNDQRPTFTSSSLVFRVSSIARH